MLRVSTAFLFGVFAGMLPFTWMSQLLPYLTFFSRESYLVIITLLGTGHLATWIPVPARANKDKLPKTEKPKHEPYQRNPYKDVKLVDSGGLKPLPYPEEKFLNKGGKKA